MVTKVDKYIGKRLAANASSFVFCGGRRSGKTYGILKFLLLTGAKERIIVNIATMTQEQGRLGSHADAKDKRTCVRRQSLTYVSVNLCYHKVPPIQHG